MKRIIVALFTLSCVHLNASMVPALNYNDSLPLRSCLYPFDYLNSEPKADAAGDQMKGIREIFQFSVSPFAQAADYSIDAAGVRVNLGDLHGRMGMLAWSYGDIPIGQSTTDVRTYATTHPFTDDTAIGTHYYSDQTYADPAQNFGFQGMPFHYKKMGTRFTIEGRIYNFTLSAYSGIADMRQSMTGLEDRTTNALATDLFGPETTYTAEDFDTDKDNIYINVTNPWQAIFDEMGINYADWHEVGMEDINIEVTWRMNFPIQQNNEERTWTSFIIVPHVTLTTTLGFGEPQNPDILLSLPFGNNGHTGFTAAGGIAFCFNDTVEVFAEGGVTAFTPQTSMIRVPTSILQYGFYPYKTSVKVKPASIYHTSIGINAHYFLDRLSGFFQFEYANHPQDDYELTYPQPEFVIPRLQKDSEWKYGVLNIGLSYDLSPSFSFGVAAQIPATQRAAYQTNTIMIGFAGTF